MKNVKVRIDVSSLMSDELTGVGVYIKNLVVSLQLFPNIKVDGTWYAEKFRSSHLIKFHTTLRLRPYFHLISGLNCGRYDIFHGPDFRIPYSRMYRKVITLHDLVDYEQGLVDRNKAEEGIRKIRHRLFVDKPHHIITVSHFTREKLLERYPQFEHMTTVVYHGIDHLARDVAFDNNQPPLPNSYILFVGNVERRKNLQTAVRAFELVKPSLPDLHFVIAGKNGYQYEAVDACISQSRYAPNIHRTGFVSQDDLLKLYHHARLLLFPSLYEGFGIPILEAMSLGCPVITSNHGAMKEIAGASAIQVDSLNAEEMAGQILEVCTNELRRKRLVEAGLSWSRRFTWKHCAEQTMQVYQQSMM